MKDGIFLEHNVSILNIVTLKFKTCTIKFDEN